MDLIDTGDFAALSAVMTYWFAAMTIMLGVIVWRMRDRFFRWRSLDERSQDDAVFTVCMLLIIFNASFQRAVATYSFAFAEWKLTGLVVTTAPIYMPTTLLALAGALWWCARELFRPTYAADAPAEVRAAGRLQMRRRQKAMWCAFMWSGLALFALMSWRF